jgi:hypothetical protein
MPLLRNSSRQGRIARTALLLIDLINDLDFDRADELLVQARPMARRLVLSNAKHLLSKFCRFTPTDVEVGLRAHGRTLLRQ